MPLRRASSRPLAAGRSAAPFATALAALVATVSAGVSAHAAEPAAPPTAKAGAPAKPTATLPAAPPTAKAGAPAKPTAPLPPARPADDIIRDAVAALGGAAVLAKHHSEHTKMTIAFQGLGITGSAEHWGAAGDKALTTTEIPNVASTREGTDGTRSWSQDPINGLRVLTGIEAEQAHLEAAWHQELRIKELFAKVEAKNDVAEDGTPLECLILTPKLSQPMTNCFDARTHLLVSQRGVRSGPQGDTPFVARLKDWRVVSGIQVPFATEMQVGPLSFAGTLTLAEFDVPIDASVFAVPDLGASEARGTKGKAGKAARPAAAKGSKAKVEAPAGSPPAP